MKNNRRATGANEECAEQQMRLNGEFNLIKAKHIKRPHLKGRNTKSTQPGEILIRLTWKKRRFLYTRLDSILQSSLFSAHCIDASPVSLTWKLGEFFGGKSSVFSVTFQRLCAVGCDVNDKWRGITRFRAFAAPSVQMTHLAPLSAITSSQFPKKISNQTRAGPRTAFLTVPRTRIPAWRSNAHFCYFDWKIS